MSFRDALEQSRLLTLAVVAALAWTAFSVTRVLGQFDYWAPEAVGMTPGAGIVGVVVMLVGLTLGLALLSGFGHAEPTADTWPPEGAEQGAATESWSEESFEQDDSAGDRLPSEGTSTE
jgi:hypothetical protein